MSSLRACPSPSLFGLLLDPAERNSKKESQEQRWPIYNYVLLPPCVPLLLGAIFTRARWFDPLRSFTNSNDYGVGNENIKKHWVFQGKQQLCTLITPFCTFLCRHCTTTTWKCRIYRFMELSNVKKRRRLFLSLSEVKWVPLKKST